MEELYKPQDLELSAQAFWRDLGFGDFVDVLQRRV